MEGRWFRKVVLAGCVAAGTVGCNRNAVQPTDAQPVQGMPMTSAAPAKSLWGNATPQPQNQQVQPTAEVVAEPPKKGPLKPETEVAIADVRLSVAFDEKTPDAVRSNALDKARQGYQKALQIDPKNKTALLAMARFYARINERDKTVDTFQKYLALYPKDHDVMYEVARTFARWQDWNSAVVWCEKALKVDPENITYRKTMAFCLACSERWEPAFAVFLTFMPEAKARYTIARVMEDHHYADAGRQQLQLALQADPSFNDASELLAELDRHSQPAAAIDPNAIQKAGYVEDSPQH